MKIPNVIVYPDHPTSVCSFWRATGPLLELSRQGKINLAEGFYKEDWSVLRAFDIAFFQRPMNKDCHDQIVTAKNLGLKIVIDLDDYNKIPEDHPVYDHYNKVYDEDVFIKMMSMADLVLTTTNQLKERYSLYSSNVHVVPNAINDHYIGARKFKPTKTVFLRGGDHHEPDIYAYKDAIIDVMNDNPDWKLEVAGSDPIFLKKEIKNYEYVGDFDIYSYFGHILHSDYSIFIHPFIDNKFNRGKSNIGLIEATISGSASLTPEWFGLEDFSIPYSDIESFKKGFEELVLSVDLRKNLHKESLIEINDKYLLSKVNEERLGLLKSVL